MASGVGSSVLVTGANRGIGLELVTQLAESTNPPKLIFAGCREPERAKDLQELSQRHPQMVIIVPLDVSDAASVSAACQVVSTRLGDAGLNLLVNNAAVNRPIPGSLAQTGADDMMEVYRTNVVGPMLLTKELMPQLQRAAAQDSESGLSCRKAAIINISTLISSIEKCYESFGMAPMYPYRTSKVALNMLTRCLSEDLCKDGILVTAIHPGWVQTDMGGSQAPLPTKDSVRGMLGVMSSLTEQHRGTLLDWKGNSIPW
ncbi:zgc:158868 [Osmerus mordax]|uniref:zgc:158868 n=1 Tax=Osmerus mordax TaxID=8014 RepID=UPI003510A2F0